MEAFITIIKSRKAALERYLQAVPMTQRRKILLYAFSGYLVLTVAVLLQVVVQIGSHKDTIMEMRHITNPVAKPAKEDSINTLKNK